MAGFQDPSDLIRLVADPLRLALLGRAAEGRLSLDEVAAAFDTPKRKVAEAVEWGQETVPSAPHKRRGKGIAACWKAPAMPPMLPAIRAAAVRIQATGNRVGTLSRAHFTALISFVMALAALGIDMILPALDEIREHFGLAPDSSRVAQIVTAFLIGLAVAQYFYGPLSDRFGRKPVLSLAAICYTLSAVSSALATSFWFFIAARMLGGVAVGLAQGQ